MPLPKLTKFELQIMDALWNQGPCSIREVQEAFPEKDRPAYTTVQTMVYRLEAKKAIRRTKRIGNAQVFEAAVTRRAAERRLVDDLLGVFGGRIQPLVAHLIDAGKLTLDDVDDARAALRKIAKKEKAE
jgi:BlaI family transcriptional regulator, penicillinase repressor